MRYLLLTCLWLAMLISVSIAGGNTGTPLTAPPLTPEQIIPPNASGEALLDNYRDGVITCDWCPPDFNLHALRDPYWSGESVTISFSWPQVIMVDYHAPIDEIIRSSGCLLSRPDTLTEWAAATDSTVEVQMVLVEVTGGLSVWDLEPALVAKGLRTASLRELLVYVQQHSNILRQFPRLIALGYCYWPPGRVVVGMGEGCYPIVEQWGGRYHLSFGPGRSWPIRRSLTMPPRSDARYLVVRTQ